MPDGTNLFNMTATYKRFIVLYRRVTDNCTIILVDIYTFYIEKYINFDTLVVDLIPLYFINNFNYNLLKTFFVLVL